MNVSDYIASGILELYVMGHLGAEEALEVERMAALYPQIDEEIGAISTMLQQEAEAATAAPHPGVKLFLMAVIDYMERLKSGEQQGFPPELQAHSRPSDYDEWLQRADLNTPGEFEHISARIIGYTPQIQTAIAWIRHLAPQEVHHHAYEKFLILEGSCDIIVDGQTHPLLPGDYFCIPLHAVHEVRITSSIPCKVLLQRVAA